jgi:hypothetical protein
VPDWNELDFLFCFVGTPSQLVVAWKGRKRKGELTLRGTMNAKCNWFDGVRHELYPLAISHSEALTAHRDRLDILQPSSIQIGDRRITQYDARLCDERGFAFFYFGNAVGWGMLIVI